MRRSHRKYTSSEIDAGHMELVLRAALMSPASKGRRAWQFVVVDDKFAIERLSDVKEAGSQFLKDAPVAIVVCGDPLQDDCWIEDGSIAAISMQYQAEELGLGTCWIQIRGRSLSDGTEAGQIVRGILDIPDNITVLCILAIGNKAVGLNPQNEEKLRWDNVHINKY